MSSISWSRSASTPRSANELSAPPSVQAMYYDIHCHLDSYPDAEPVVRRAREAGVGLILTNGTNPAENRAALGLADRFAEVEAALGLYPNEALKLSDEEVAAELEWIGRQRPRAIGEIGLDYHHDDSRKERMRAVFTDSLSVAERIGRPVLVHSRKAEAEVIDILGSADVTADLHCFGGSLKLARRAADSGCYFSIPASIVRSTHFQRLVEELPDDLLLTETDSPWLSPDPERQNEPANIPLVVREIARVRRLDEVGCRDLLWRNAERFMR